ncbi:MAG: type III pantothenate kinase [Nitrospirales bacterium]|nr:type III pantothenate kinase [Nitrospira sp.]MDR4502837.1 type III pantothenate kinase [Nitrospirales bacterium]
MLLAIDIGNTHIVGGIFENDHLRASWRLATDHTKTSDEYGILSLALLNSHRIAQSNITGCIISSVVPPLTIVFETMVQTYFGQHALVVNSQSPLGLTLRYQHPEEIGTDRLVNAAAAFARFKKGLIIVDFGTATTFCTITASGEYLGGAIAPGLKSAADSFHERTAQLPSVDLILPPSVIGTNTISSMQSGLVFGYAGLVDGLVTRIQTEIAQPMHVIATGGLANIIQDISRTIDEIRPHLTLEGLELLYRRMTTQYSA